MSQSNQVIDKDSINYVKIKLCKNSASPEVLKGELINTNRDQFIFKCSNLDYIKRFKILKDNFYVNTLTDFKNGYIEEQFRIYKIVWYDKDNNIIQINESKSKIKDIKDININKNKI